MTEKKEIWKKIEGLSKYEFSSHGRIRDSITKHVHVIPLNSSSGYPCKTLLYDDGSRRTRSIHILVAEAFLGPRPERCDINHKDGDKTNNHVDNLEYCTRSDNILHAYEHDLNAYKKRIKIVETGEIFSSINECARAIDGDPENIRQCAEPKYSRSRCCGYHFEFVDDDCGNLHEPISIKIVETGEIFTSARECERAICGNHRAITKSAETGKPYKGYHFEFINNFDTKSNGKTKTDPNQILYDFQLDAMNRMFSGCILNGGTGSGKSLTSLFYYMKEQGGWIDKKGYQLMKNPKDLYIITTAKKRDDLEWEGELANILLSTNPTKCTMYNNKVIVDSWQNIKKYADVTDSFIIYDEDFLTGSGTWVKTFLKMAKHNDFVVLSATPGDVWMDYVPIFIANDFFKNRTEFIREHVVYSRYCKFPKVDRYINDQRLMRLRNRILIDMDFERDTTQHHDDIYCTYDIKLYKDTIKNRWNPFEQKPIETAAELCYTLRKIVNSDEARVVALMEILEKTPRAIIFYSFDYELDILRHLFWDVDGVEENPLNEYEFAEYNGHLHQEIPKSEKWVYAVNYSSGAEGFNCIKTDTIIFFSQTYSYKTLLQACGRIDRLNTPFNDLYYYHLKSRSGIDLAISKALREKKKFNERKFARWD